MNDDGKDFDNDDDLVCNEDANDLKNNNYDLDQNYKSNGDHGEH